MEGTTQKDLELASQFYMKITWELLLAEGDERFACPGRIDIFTS
jgi:hypothetical protein